MRSSPQFGFTLAAYEVLQGVLPMPGSEKEEVPHAGVSAVGEGLPGQEGPIGFLRSRNAMKIILDLDGDFGKIKNPAGKEGWNGLPKIVGGGK